MRILFLLLIVSTLASGQKAPDQNKAEKSVKKYMSSKFKKYLPEDFGECFTSENFAKELQEKYKTKKKPTYTIEHTYSIDGEYVKGMNFHLDEYYNVIIHNSKDATITLITDDSKGDRQEEYSPDKIMLAQQQPVGIIEDTHQSKVGFVFIMNGKELSLDTSKTKLSLDIIYSSTYGKRHNDTLINLNYQNGQFYYLSRLFKDYDDLILNFTYDTLHISAEMHGGNLIKDTVKIIFGYCSLKKEPTKFKVNHKDFIIHPGVKATFYGHNHLGNKSNIFKPVKVARIYFSSKGPDSSEIFESNLKVK